MLVHQLVLAGNLWPTVVVLGLGYVGANPLSKTLSAPIYGFHFIVCGAYFLYKILVSQC